MIDLSAIPLGVGLFYFGSWAMVFLCGLTYTCLAHDWIDDVKSKNPIVLFFKSFWVLIPLTTTGLMLFLIVYAFAYNPLFVVFSFLYCLPFYTVIVYFIFSATTGAIEGFKYSLLKRKTTYYIGVGEENFGVCEDFFVNKKGKIVSSRCDSSYNGEKFEEKNWEIGSYNVLQTINWSLVNTETRSEASKKYRKRYGKENELKGEV